MLFLQRLHARQGIAGLLIAAGLWGCGGVEESESSGEVAPPTAAQASAGTAPRATQNVTPGVNSGLSLEQRLREGARLNALELDAANRRETLSAAEMRKAAPGQALGADVVRKLATRTSVWRFYNTTNSSHFYTAGQQEADSVRANPALRHLTFEGRAFETGGESSAGMSPVYRFFSVATNASFYTMSERERDYVVNNLREYKLEGVAFYASKVPGAGLRAVHRFYRADRGSHFYSVGEAEVAKVRSTQREYTYEGIGYYVLADAETVAPANAEQAGRFLGQATFGPDDAGIRKVQSLGYDGWLNEQLAQPIQRRHFDVLFADGHHTNARGDQWLDNTIYASYINAPDQLRKRVGYALSQIFVVGTDSLEGNVRMFGSASFLDMLEANAFGNYRELLEAVSRHPAMGGFLTYSNNCKADPRSGRLPDENYAREVMQLFSIGLLALNPDGSVRMPLRETYTQTDVSELAKVFTGFRWDVSDKEANTDPQFWRKNMVVDTRCEETAGKAFLGSSIAGGKGANASLEAAMDTLSNHPNVGPFIGKQLIQRLVTSNPSPAYVARVTDAFNNNGSGVRGDMKAVIKAVLLDPEVRGTSQLSNPKWGKLREPVVRLMHWARSTRATSKDGKWDFGDLRSPVNRLGQAPMHSPSVFNFYRPGYVPPNTSIADAGLVAPEFQITSEATTIGYVNYMQEVIDGRHGPRNTGEITSTYASEVSLTVDALVDRLNVMFTQGALTAATRTKIVAALNSMPATNDAQKLQRAKAAVLLFMASPEYIAQK